MADPKDLLPGMLVRVQNSCPSMLWRGAIVRIVSVADDVVIAEFPANALGGAGQESFEPRDLSPLVVYDEVSNKASLSRNNRPAIRVIVPGRQEALKALTIYHEQLRDLAKTLNEQWKANGRPSSIYNDLIKVMGDERAVRSVIQQLYPEASDVLSL